MTRSRYSEATNFLEDLKIRMARDWRNDLISGFVCRARGAGLIRLEVSQGFYEMFAEIT